MSETRSNHTVYNINYHFVWCPKYRHPILDGEIGASIERRIREVCEDYGYTVLSLHISPDHVHLFVSAPASPTKPPLTTRNDHVHLFVSAHPKHSPSEIVRVVKSVTARDAWDEYESILEQYFWGGGFWEESYYVGTAGAVSSDVIEDYINRSEHV